MRWVLLEVISICPVLVVGLCICGEALEVKQLQENRLLISVERSGKEIESQELVKIEFGRNA